MKRMGWKTNQRSIKGFPSGSEGLVESGSQLYCVIFLHRAVRFFSTEFNSPNMSVTKN